jgi:hypothetical protein
VPRGTEEAGSVSDDYNDYVSQVTFERRKAFPGEIRANDGSWAIILHLDGRVTGETDKFLAWLEAADNVEMVSHGIEFWLIARAIREDARRSAT